MYGVEIWHEDTEDVELHDRYRKRAAAVKAARRVHEETGRPVAVKCPHGWTSWDSRVNE